MGFCHLDLEFKVMKLIQQVGEITLFLKNALDLWNSLFSLGIDLKPIGLAARNTLRLLV